MKIKVVFDLPEGMSEQDLEILLKDALDDFRTVRCNGDAMRHALKKHGLGEEALVEPDLCRRVVPTRDQVQTRFDWTRHLQASDNIHLYDPRWDGDI